jgi:predicted Rossmann fold nucleotide-binding protein DprA/Smf involved in DNA uptake
MKTIIAGCRDVNDYNAVVEAVRDSEFQITEVVSGKAAGVDTLGERWAQENGIPVKEFPADWDRYGKRAGPIRNRQMAEYAEALIAVWDEKSAGTMNMISIAMDLGLLVYVHPVKRGEDG